jgi:SAM-dependent methyltransferase
MDISTKENNRKNNRINEIIMNYKVIRQMIRRTRRMARKQGVGYVLTKVPAGAKIVFNSGFSRIISTVLPISSPELKFKNKRDEILANRTQYRDFDKDHEVLLDAISSRCGTDRSVLDLGCGAGSHLAYLYENGFTDLYGIDINETKVELMRSEFSETYANSEIIVGPAQEHLGEFTTGQFDVVYSIATLQHIQSDLEELYSEIARVCSGYLFVLEIDAEAFEFERDTAELSFGWFLNADLRNYREVFEEYGFKEVGARKPWKDTTETTQFRNGLYTLRVFERNHHLDL